MKKHLLKVTSCALLIAILMAPVVKASEFDGIDLSYPATATTEKPRGSGSKIHPYKTVKKGIENFKAVNPDVVGWLTVPGTSISTPITFNAKSNAYYLRRDWRGKNYPDLVYENWSKKPATANYLDYRVKLGESWMDSNTSRNIVIYGHNWNNLKTPLVIGPGKGPDGNELTMFAQMPSYTNKEFAEKNPYIYFSTEKYEGVWKVFSVAYCELTNKFPYNSPNPGKEGTENLIKEWKSRSIYNFDTAVSTGDRLLTLSTCTRQYSVGAYQRYVVMARLLRNGESEDDKVKVTVNTKAVAPKFN